MYAVKFGIHERVSVINRSYHIKVGHYRPASETPLKLRLAGGPTVARNSVLAWVFNVVRVRALRRLNSQNWWQGQYVTRIEEPKVGTYQLSISICISISSWLETGRIILNKTWPEVINFLSCSTQLSMKFINCS